MKPLNTQYYFQTSASVPARSPLDVSGLTSQSLYCRVFLVLNASPLFSQLTQHFLFLLGKDLKGLGIVFIHFSCEASESVL